MRKLGHVLCGRYTAVALAKTEEVAITQRPIFLKCPNLNAYNNLHGI